MYKFQSKHKRNMALLFLLFISIAIAVIIINESVSAEEREVRRIATEFLVNLKDRDFEGAQRYIHPRSLSSLEVSFELFEAVNGIKNITEERFGDVWDGRRNLETIRWGRGNSNLILRDDINAACENMNEKRRKLKRCTVCCDIEDVPQIIWLELDDEDNRWKIITR